MEKAQYLFRFYILRFVFKKPTDISHSFKLLNPSDTTIGIGTTIVVAMCHKKPGVLFSCDFLVLFWQHKRILRCWSIS